jgi:hypothetical protein
MIERKLCFIFGLAFIVFSGLFIVTAWIRDKVFDQNSQWLIDLYWVLVPNAWLIGIFTIISWVVFLFLLIHKPNTIDIKGAVQK